MVIRWQLKLWVTAALAFGPMAYAFDNPAMDAEVHHIDNEWARIKFQVADKDEQLREIDALAKEAAKVVDRYPNRAEPLIWDGIVTGQEAAMASVFRRLDLAADARKMFEKADAIDPKALDGAAAVSLGVLYYKVPGFPIGFGDDKAARRYLEAALAIDPAGLDANYFYGEFLVRRGEYDRAKEALAHALETPTNPDRPVWDAGRRAAIRALIASIDKRTHP